MENQSSTEERWGELRMTSSSKWLINSLCQLSVGSSAHLVEHCTDVARVLGSNTVQACIIKALFSLCCLINFNNCNDPSQIHLLIRSFKCIFIYWQSFVLCYALHNHTQKRMETNFFNWTMKTKRALCRIQAVVVLCIE